jgi:hypothetical protein
MRRTWRRRGSGCGGCRRWGEREPGRVHLPASCARSIATTPHTGQVVRFRPLALSHRTKVQVGCGFLLSHTPDLGGAYTAAGQCTTNTACGTAHFSSVRSSLRRHAHLFRSPAINLNCSSAASRSSTISAARMPGSGRLALSSRLSSFSQKMSRLALSRAMISS